MEDFFDNIQDVSVEQKETANMSPSFYIRLSGDVSYSDVGIFCILGEVIKSRLKTMCPLSVEMNAKTVTTRKDTLKENYNIFVEYDVFGKPETVDDVLKIIYSTFWFNSIKLNTGYISFALSVGKMITNEENITISSSIETTLCYFYRPQRDDAKLPFRKFLRNASRFMLDDIKMNNLELSEYIMWKTCEWNAEPACLQVLVSYAHQFGTRRILLPHGNYSYVSSECVPRKKHKSLVYRLLTERISEDGFSKLINGDFSKDVTVMWCSVPLVRDNGDSQYVDYFFNDDNGDKTEDTIDKKRVTVVSKIEPNDLVTKSLCRTPYAKLCSKTVPEVLALMRNKSQILRKRKLRVLDNKKKLSCIAPMINLYRYTKNTADIVANVCEYYDYETKHIMLLVIRIYGKKEDVSCTLDELMQ